MWGTPISSGSLWTGLSARTLRVTIRPSRYHHGDPHDEMAGKANRSCIAQTCAAYHHVAILEGASRAVLRQDSQAHNRVRALGHRLGAAVVVEVGSGTA